MVEKNEQKEVHTKITGSKTTHQVNHVDNKYYRFTGSLLLNNFVAKS